MKTAALFVSLFISLISFGQKEALIWHFGIQAGLDFNCNPPKVIGASSTFGLLEGSSTICDKNGNLLFYSNGDSAWDRNHNVMPNGYGLGQYHFASGSSTQGSIIIPVPDTDSLFYIFTTDNAEHRLANGFRYSLVDMSLRGGLGDVIIRSQLLIDTVCEKLTAVHHTNGKDIWVLTHEYNSDAFYAYLVTSSGLNTNPIISHAGQVQFETSPSVLPQSLARGTMKISPDGKKLVVLTFSDHHKYPLKPEIFDFDASNGNVSLDFTVEDKDSTEYYGASFSPNSNLLYLSAGWRGLYLHQFDMTTATNSANFLASKTAIQERSWSSNPPLMGALSIGPNGKIYVATNKIWVDVIHKPNVKGIGCQYEEESISLITCLKTYHSSYSLPNYIQSYFLDTISGIPCIDTSLAQFSFIDSCIQSTANFYDESSLFPEDINYRKWNFGDPNSNENNISSIANPIHKFTSAGSYIVTLIVASDTSASPCRSDTIVKTVQIINCEDKDTSPIDDFHLYIPDAFTTNSDGLNDNFRVIGEKISSVKMQIFNRWGDLIFDENSIDPRWDGTYLDKLCQGGNYLYLINVIDIYDRHHGFHGVVTLLR